MKGLRRTVGALLLIGATTTPVIGAPTALIDAARRGDANTVRTRPSSPSSTQPHAAVNAIRVSGEQRRRSIAGRNFASGWPVVASGTGSAHHARHASGVSSPGAHADQRSTRALRSFAGTELTN